MFRPAGLAVALIALLACAGLPRLTVDGDAPWRLDPSDPLLAVNARLVEATGGDDLLAVVLMDSREGAHGLLDPEGVQAIESVRKALHGAPGLERVRAVTTAPLIDVHGGTITAHTPLSPPPTDAAAWARAREQVAADPFAAQMISPDGRVAAVVGWIARGSTDSALVRRVDVILRAGSLPREEALPLRQLISTARLAVALGEADGPPDAAAARALRESPIVADRGWLREAEAQVADPDASALVSARAALAGLALPVGIRAEPAGPQATEEALAQETPRSIRMALLAILAAAGLAGARVRRRPIEGLAAALGGALSFGGTLGLCGWLGLGLHPWLAMLALLAAAWTATLIVAGRGQSLLLAPGVAAPAGLAMALGGGLGVGTAAIGALVLGLGLAWGASGATQVEPPPGPPRSLVLPGALVLVLGLTALIDQPLGIDPARMVGASHPTGAATAALGAGPGTAPSAFLVFDGGAPRALARPSALAGIATVQDAIGLDGAVSGSASWADLIGALHRAVLGPDAPRLPEDAAVVEQYLLLFGRPQDARTLAAPDLSLAVVLLRFAPGGGAHLARLSDRFPADEDTVTLAGQAVAMARAARRRARLALLGAGLGLGLLGLSLVPRRARVAGILVWSTACGVIAVAISAWSLGSLGFPAVLAGAVASGGSVATLLGPRGRVAAVPLLGLVVLVPSPVALFSSFALGACAGLGMALFAGSVASRP